MAEKKLTLEELDHIGLVCIEIDWDNLQKLTAMFHHYVTQKEPLPSSGVNDNGDAIPNLSKLARLAKVKQGKQVFQAHYARKMLDTAIINSGIEDPSKTEEQDETKTVREKLQKSIDEARSNASNTDTKLKLALDKVDALTDENKRMTLEIIELKAKLSVANNMAGDAKKRLITASHQERVSLKRVF
jgi:hypothetical protein